MQPAFDFFGVSYGASNRFRFSLVIARANLRCVRPKKDNAFLAYRTSCGPDYVSAVFFIWTAVITHRPVPDYVGWGHSEFHVVLSANSDCHKYTIHSLHPFLQHLMTHESETLWPMSHSTLGSSFSIPPSDLVILHAAILSMQVTWYPADCAAIYCSKGENKGKIQILRFGFASRMSSKSRQDWS
jgi:hypothetical protein